MNSTYQTTKPTPQQVRALTLKHRAERTPPLSPEQIRRELGWDLIGKSRTR